MSKLRICLLVGFGLIVLGVIIYLSSKAGEGGELILSQAFTALLTVVAIYFAPIVALDIQKEKEVIKDKRTRQLTIFMSLMATRASPESPEHVRALNMIDIEFYKEKEIINCWREHLDHMSTPLEKGASESDYKAWLEKKTEYLVSLLYAISQFLGYDFDTVYIKKGVYLPNLYANERASQVELRSLMMMILSGQKALKIENIVEKSKEQAREITKNADTIT